MVPISNLSALSTIVLIVSLVGLIAAVSYRNIKKEKWGRLGLDLFVIGLAVLFLYKVFRFPHIEKGLESRGADAEKLVIIICYICMIVGMVAQYFYRQGAAGRTKFRVELVPLLTPILASPIVFIPLIAIFGEIVKDSASASKVFEKSKLMIYFVAFQNGFFWEDLFERQKQKFPSSPMEASVALPNMGESV